MPRPTPLALVLAGAALAAAAPASAATFCVNSGGTGGCSATIADALPLAAGSPGRDTITVGAGTYAGSVGLSGANPVDIVGSGPATTLTGSGVVLSVDDSSASITDLTVQVPDNGSGLALAGAADRVDVVAAPGLVRGTGVTTSFVGGNGTFRNGAITLPLAAGTTGAAGGPAPGRVTVQDSVVTAGVGLSGAATVLRSVVRAGQGAIMAPPPGLANAKTVIEDSTILTRADAGLPERGLAATGGPGAFPGQELIARHDTIVGSGTPSAIGIEAKADTGPGPSVLAPVSVTNSILRGYATGISRTGTASPVMGVGAGVANVSALYSDVSGPVTDTGPGSLTKATVDTDPRFRDAANGDFRLRGDSPLIDAGDPAGLAAGESATDAAGLPRIAGARTDMGAFEYQGLPVPGTPASIAPPKIKSLRATRSKRGITFTYVLSRVARVKITIYRGKKKVRALSRTGKPGRNTFVFKGKIGRRKLQGGNYRARLVATDASGQRSPARSLGFRL